jgi:hypothetical protein
MKRHFLDKPILRHLFWFIVLPYSLKQFLVSRPSEAQSKDKP